MAASPAQRQRVRHTRMPAEDRGILSVSWTRSRPEEHVLVVNDTHERREDVSGEFPIQCSWTGGNFSTSPPMAQSRQQEPVMTRRWIAKQPHAFLNLIYLFVFDVPDRNKQVAHQQTDVFHPLSLNG